MIIFWHWLYNKELLQSHNIQIVYDFQILVKESYTRSFPDAFPNAKLNLIFKVIFQKV